MLLPFTTTGFYAVPIFVMVAACVFSAHGMSRGLWRYFSLADLFVVVKAATVAIMLAIPPLLMLGLLDTMPLTVPFLQWLLLVVALSGSRLLYRQFFASRRTASANAGAEAEECALLIGDADTAYLMIEARHLGPQRYRIVGILDPQRGHVGRSIGQVPIVAAPDDLERVVATFAVHGIYPECLLVTRSEPGLTAEARNRLGLLAQSVGLRLELVADPLPSRRTVERQTVVQPSTLPPSSVWTRVLDICVASALLILTFPLLLVVAAVICFSMGAPVIFSQVRLGLQMRPFTVYKFRTLRNPGPAMSDLPDKARETAVGRVLRRTRIDELPQLWNVLRGDMSVIGPRPLLNRDMADGAVALAERCSIRPGITGWAQVNGGQQLSPREKLALDLWYIRQRTLWLDLRVLWLTLRMIVLGERVNTHNVLDALRQVPAA